MSNRHTVQPSKKSASRRRFIKRMIAAGAAVSSANAMLDTGGGLVAQSAPGIRSFDHVALPMQNVEAMVAFYRALGLKVNQTAQRVSVHFGDQKINFHLPSQWQRESFTLRAPAAKPPCGDFCWVWEGSPESLRTTLDRAGAKIIEGPGPRDGGRNGGTVTGQSVYVRDPDGNLLEFMIYS
jgi:catechol 2,3-dioxygenase-like lactoylglutathione lyase family enzyme